MRLRRISGLFLVFLLYSVALEAAWQAPLISSVAPSSATAKPTAQTFQVKGKNFHQGLILSTGTASNVGGNGFTWSVLMPAAGYVVLQATNTDGKSSNVVTITVLSATPQPPQHAPLAITCPVVPPVTASTVPWPVSWPAALPLGGVKPVQVTDSIPSGSSFPAGPTTITSTAVDSTGDIKQCQFTVTVTYTPAPSTVSLDGTTMPPAATITVEDLSVWTMHPSTSWPAPQMEIWRNGAIFSAGIGSIVKKCLTTAFTFGTDAVWYQPVLAPEGWLRLTATDPCAATTICQDPSATNNGGPLPCTYPPPPPAVGFRLYVDTNAPVLSALNARSHELVLTAGIHTITVSSISIDLATGAPMPSTESLHTSSMPNPMTIAVSGPYLVVWDWMP